MQGLTDHAHRLETFVSGAKSHATHTTTPEAARQKADRLHEHGKEKEVRKWKYYDAERNKTEENERRKRRVDGTILTVGARERE